MHIARQSGITYLKTEIDLAKELGIEISCPVRLFDLDGIGIDKVSFLKDLAPCFERLAWDMYDVKREQVAFLIAQFPERTSYLQDFLVAYFKDDVSLRKLEYLFREMSDDVKRRFERIRSYRRRSIARFVVTKQDTAIWHDEWHVIRTECTGFTQAVVKDDPRSLTRIYDPTSATTIAHPEFQKLIIAVAEMVEDAELDCGRQVKGMTLTFHKMGLVAVPGVASSNAPEGIHKDGADYVVSALVIERDAIKGGVSTVYGPDKETAYLDVVLEPGQGIFQADQHSTLWHDVTPVVVEDCSVDGEGVRNIFGFDIEVHQ